MQRKILLCVILIAIVFNMFVNAATARIDTEWGEPIILTHDEAEKTATVSSFHDSFEARGNHIKSTSNAHVEEGAGVNPNTLIMDESPAGGAVIVPRRILPRLVRLPSWADRCRLSMRDEDMILQKCVEIFEGNDRDDLVEKWVEATLSRAYLEYNAYFEKIQWIISVRHGSTCIGTIALETSGDLAWVNPNPTISIDQSAREAEMALRKHVGKYERVRERSLKLMTVQGSHCWFYENSKAAYLVDISTAKVVEVSQAELMTPDYSDDMTPKANNEIQPDTVPWFWQGYKPWCGMYSTTMVLAWWGNTTAQTDEDSCAYDIARVAQGLDPPDTDSGSYIGTLEYAAKELNYPMMGTWHGEMKTIWSSDGVAPYYIDDVKDCISSNGYIVVIEVDCDGSKATYDLHAVVIIGYDDADQLVYVHDPSGAWTWNGGDTWASYTNLESRWGTWDDEGGFWDRDTPGLTWTHRHKHLGMMIYPGNYDPPVATAYLETPPTTMIDTEKITLTATLVGPAKSSQSGGLFIWADGGEIVSCSTTDFTVYSYDTSANPISLPAPIIELRRGYIMMGTSYTAEITIRPTAPGSMRIHYRGWVVAFYDFVHCNYDFSKVNPWETRHHTTTVYDDSAESPIDMPRCEHWIARDPLAVADDRYDGSYKFTWYSNYFHDVSVVEHSDTAVISTTPVDDSVLKVLDELGYSYDYFSYGSFPADYSAYRTIIQAMDGGTTLQIPELADYIEAGGRAILLGGSNWAPFVQDVNTYLMGVNITYHSWRQVSGYPHIQTTDLSHSLARALPVTYNFTSMSATNYMLRITDPEPDVVAMNGDGYKAIVKKKLDNGTFTWFINSPYEGYWTDAGDYNYLKTFLGNALSVDIAVISVLAPLEGSVLRILDELGYMYDYYYCTDLADFPDDYDRYNIIIQVMDGGYDHQIPELARFVEDGGRAILLGGSNYQPFAQDVNDYLMSVNTTYHSWTQVSSTPHITIVDPNHSLAEDLPITNDFSDIMATSYMLRITDPESHVVAVNGDGYKAVVTNKLGYGRFTYFINPGDDWVWTYPEDYAYLKTFLRNALKPADIAVVTSTTIDGSVLMVLDELGYICDYYYIGSSGEGTDFPSDYRSYRVIIQVMNGGYVLEIPRLADYVSSGGQAILLGGSNYQPFVLDVDTYLMRVNTTKHYWTGPVGSPDITIVDPDHPWAKDLPLTNDFNNTYASRYMLRIIDPAPHLIAINGDGDKTIVTKRLGHGRFTYFINHGWDNAWTDPGDYRYLKIFLRNVLRPLGDVNHDHYVDQMDLSLIGEALGTVTGDPDYNPDADLNKDGRVDVDDIILFKDYWNHFLFD